MISKIEYIAIATSAENNIVRDELIPKEIRYLLKPVAIVLPKATNINLKLLWLMWSRLRFYPQNMFYIINLLNSVFF
jgi:hypothetical protein